MSELNNENIIHKVYDDIEIIQFKRLLEFPNLVHCYTLRKHNVNINSSEANRQNFKTHITKYQKY